MRVWGKIVGGILGYIAGGGPLGAFIGAALGHALDVNAPALGWFDLKDAQRAFFETLFAVMGHLARADGRVSEQEIGVAERVMQRMRLDRERRQQAIRLFNLGKQPGFDLDGAVGRLRASCGVQPQLFRLFVELQLETALADGAIKPQGRAVLERICRGLGIPIWELERMYAGRAWAGGSTRGRVRDALGGDPYQVLGIDRRASPSEIKRAYRRLISQNHPDKMVSRGLPKAMLDLAKEKTAEIRAAYERIRTERGFR